MAASNNSKTAAKAKTTPTRKPSKSTPVPGSPVLAGIQLIPLNQLSLSTKNVRKVPATEKEDAELLASIRENGIKQNLVGYEHAKAGFLIDAGGRRLKTLQTLAEEGAIAIDYPVACLIEDEAEATVSSTTENSQRAAMQVIHFAMEHGEGCRASVRCLAKRKPPGFKAATENLTFNLQEKPKGTASAA